MLSDKDYTSRLLSFRSLFKNEDKAHRFSCLSLAEAGFTYLDANRVQCTECENTLEIEYFTSSPKTSLYHREECKFAEAEGAGTSTSLKDKASEYIGQTETLAGIESDAASAVSEVCDRKSPSLSRPQFRNDLKNLQPYQQVQWAGSAEAAVLDAAGATLPSENAVLSIYNEDKNTNWKTTGRNQQFNPSTTSSTVTDLRGELTLASASASPNLTNTLDSASVATEPASTWDCTSASAEPKYTWDSASASSETTLDSVENYSKDHPDQGFYDQHSFQNEFVSNIAKNVQSVQTHCEKNPGHFSYFSPGNLKLQHIPQSVQRSEVLRLLQLCCLLTVRVVVKGISEKRPHYARPNTKDCVGTGSCLTFECRTQAQNSEDKSQNKEKSVKSYLPFRKKKMGIIYIETNRHIVYDDSEAENTTVEFFYDRQDREGVEIVKAVEVKHSKTPGVYKSVLVCKTTNLKLIEKLNSYREEFFRLARNMPENIHEALTNKIFVIGHPHGGEKVLSYGESVVVKYMLKSETLTMEKVNNQQQLPQDKFSVRKVLLYTADTCEGSSGSPVITFKNVPGGVELDLWMHKGFDKKHELSGSVMKVLSAEDIVSHGQPTRPRRSEVNQCAGDGLSSETPVSQGPVLTVTGHPAHPAYIAYQSRLDSFAAWKYEHIQPKKVLADAGFFNAGYADCARCFQCGLGLRTWKQGDDVFVEHYRYKPTCQFLLSQLRAKGITPESLIQNGRQISARGRTNSKQTMKIVWNNLIVGKKLWRHEENNSTINLCRVSEYLTTVKAFVHKQRKQLYSNDVVHRAPICEVPAVQQTLHTSVKQASSTGLKTVLENITAFPVSSLDPVLVADAGGDSTSRGASVVQTLLEKENQLLQKQLMCKVCFQKPVRDLFLPCSELYACTDCSKLLARCPSCNKKITATVTTFFT